MKKHLITGITGQDGIFLTKKILQENKNDYVIGISRDKDSKNFFKKLSSLNTENLEKVSVLNTDLRNTDAVEDLLKNVDPDFLYNLSGPSSPYDSIRNPDIYKDIENVFNNLINGLIKFDNLCNFFQASTSEMFLANTKKRLDEKSLFGAKSPYAEFKLKNHNKVIQLREQYDWKIYSGIMFNHESEFRKNNYLFMKIIDSAIKIKNGRNKKLTLGSLSYTRDWSFAGDVSSAIYKITNFGKDCTYVIGSGKENTIQDLVSVVFDYFNINQEGNLAVDESILRKGDSEYIVSNPKKIKDELNWKTKLGFEDLVIRCIELSDASNKFTR